MTRGCNREPEVLDAVLSGAWSGAAGAALRAHVESCPCCRELSVVAGAVRQDAEALAADAPVPTAGAMWWRLQIRRRHELARAAERPILAIELLALASLGGAVVALVLVTLAWLGRPADGTVAAGAASALTGLSHSSALVQSSLPLAATALLLAAAVPVVCYLVLSRD